MTHARRRCQTRESSVGNKRRSFNVAGRLYCLSSAGAATSRRGTCHNNFAIAPSAWSIAVLMRNAMSTPSSCRSTIRVVTSTSTRTSGHWTKKPGNKVASKTREAFIGQLTRTLPRGAALRFEITSIPARASVSIARQCLSKSSPAWVNDRRRVVRCNRRTPRRASRSDSRRERRDFGIPSARSVAEYPPCSITWTK